LYLPVNRSKLDESVKGRAYSDMAIVRLTPEAREQFAGLPKGIKPRISKLIGRLSNWPNVSGAKQLSGNLAGHYRLRTGDYRVQFVPTPAGNDWLVTVEKIGHRDGFYDNDD
jgi:mRNA-degrading endonuclease RelE of RelBE toxin-antitoxin system